MTPECFAQTQQEESSQPELLIPASLSLPHHLVSVHVHLEILPILLCTSHSHLPVEFSPFSFPQSLTHPDGSVTQTYCIVKKKKKSKCPNLSPMLYLLAPIETRFPIDHGFLCRTLNGKILFFLLYHPDKVGPFCYFPIYIFRFIVLPLMCK